jgi:protein gp37
VFLAGVFNCYAERVAARFSSIGMPYEGLARSVAVTKDKGGEFPIVQSEARWTGEVAFIEDRLNDPLHWKKPRMIFVNSMSDLFHEKVSDEWLIEIFNVMVRAQKHTFQCLTKRPERMMSWMKHLYEGRIAPAPPHNVWMGVSVEDQKTADERIPFLLRTPAAVRWVSYEPALGPVDFRSHLQGYCAEHDFSGGFCIERKHYGVQHLHWIVCGGESGLGARPMHPDWARAARDQCVAAGVAFHFKQHGEWLHRSQETKYLEVGEPESQEFIHAGKRAAGRLLDGREWNQYPNMEAR